MCACFHPFTKATQETSLRVNPEVVLRDCLFSNHALQQVIVRLLLHARHNVKQETKL
jgi:hypothetical protein